jgi:hypothetical protein
MNHIIKYNNFYKRNNIFTLLTKKIQQHKNKKITMSEENNEFCKSFQEFEWIKQYSPCFQIKSNDIEILSSPTDFYNYLKVIEKKLNLDNRKS